MMKKISKQPWSISGRFIFITFAALMVFNLFLLIFYTEYSKTEAVRADQEEIINQVVNTVYLFDISPPKEWNRITQISKTEQIDVSLSPAPHSINQYSRDDLWEISRYIPENKSEWDLSVMLVNGKWANFQITPILEFRLLPLFIIAIETLVAFVILFAAWSMAQFTRPLRSFKKVAEQLGMKMHAPPIVEYGPAIVRETADAFNQMQRRIRDLLQDRNRILAAISHDLRTPITRLKLRNELILKDDDLQESLRDLNEMEAMIDQILSYTRDASAQEEKADIDLVALLSTLCDEVAEEGHHIESEFAVQRLPFKGQPLALRRAFRNIINNAIRYAKYIKVKLIIEENLTTITIEDDGPGIPEAQLDKVFTAFYRVDSSRNKQTGGTGLGLAIAQDVIHAHNGAITLNNLAEKGLQVKVTFI